MKARKKPLVINVVRLKKDGSNIFEVQDFVGKWLVYDPNKNQYFIQTLEGNMYVSLGDYIIKGVNGEFYPCKPDIFEKTYDIIN
ncbi:hypothetical protein [Carnobacterium mobile]|uniref:hypothetical protein n=1 Tax=Carnobacterium mobile TaxID=2750 RepID=UPI0005569CE5|nr:hypothetical protein [Carnobacterium mobile]